jgi:hypothetical protein
VTSIAAGAPPTTKAASGVAFLRRIVKVLPDTVNPGSASAETEAQFTAPGLRAPDDANVNGLRFTIFHGKNESVRGFDFGLLSLSETGQLSGLGLVIGLGKVAGSMPGGAPPL